MNTLKVIGIITYILIILTLSLGLFGRKLFPKVWFKFHRLFALLTLLVATLHAVLAIFYF